MEGNLFIVESPHKAGQIQGFLGKDFKVVSSKGHIRDLDENGMSIDIDNGFTPEYIIPDGKKSLVASLKNLADKAGTVWLASDPDREGEAIAWHLVQALAIDPSKIKRITYNEVTKSAVLEAMKHPRQVDMDLVNAQQARRVLDRLVGFELSPILWRKIRRGLSAGRVQSVTLRLVVDREREIAAFNPEPYYCVSARFVLSGQKVKGVLDTRFGTTEDARAFLQDSIGASYKVRSVEKKEGRRTPAAPFTTSTLQQEAARKLRFNSSRTMSIAQSLYEKGLITYMRTDSTNLSGLAINTAKDYVIRNFGEEYSRPRNYKTRTRGAQEAHEAIRPTFIGTEDIDGTAEEKKLYSLIWKRTVSSQMADAQLLNTSIRIGSDKRGELYEVRSAEILFDGFLKVYLEGSDDTPDEEEQVILPEVKKGESVDCVAVDAECRFTQAPLRYSEQTLIKKMEEIGIGRPSTYAPTLKTLSTGRGYIDFADKEGIPHEVINLKLSGGTISEIRKKEMVGAEKRKLVPTDIGMAVTDYLKANFTDVMDFDFTANVEEDFDCIAEGRKEWTSVISDFYGSFHKKVDDAMANREYTRIERMLGIDPADGREIVAKLGQYGPYVQKGEGENKVFASLGKGQLVESITLEEAVKLFQLPRTVGEYKGVPVIALKGRFGPYIKYGDTNVSLPRSKDPLKITIEECAAVIDAEQTKAKGPVVLAEFPGGIQVIEGRFGPYIKQDGNNFKIPAGMDAATLTAQQCQDIVSKGTPTSRKRYFKKKSKK